jgi:hypothetical protein
MIPEMKGWKVITQDRLSANTPDLYYGQRFVSLHAVHYPINEIVFSRILNSKLFFFKNKEDALTFMTNLKNVLYENRLVVPCIAYNCARLKSMPNVFLTVCFEEFWKRKLWKKKYGGMSCPVPQGTWVAERIKCLE